MAFQKSQMLYDDGKYYKWTAQADHDNPYYTTGTDHSELNRTEGYEVKYFINHFGEKHFDTEPQTTTYQKIETMIRYAVPGNIRTHKKIADWIIENWKDH
ncbi:MAG TPA: hypothetical protein VK498_01865 [Ferruginibacter sp.]|nr:hypothetical protein [Ferruginibacter sp.]